MLERLVNLSTRYLGARSLKHLFKAFLYGKGIQTRKVIKQFFVGDQCLYFLV